MWSNFKLAQTGLDTGTYVRYDGVIFPIFG